MILAIVIGIGFHNFVGTPLQAKDGVAFILRKVSRVGIILLGLQLTAAQVVLVGPAGIGIIAITLVATFAFTIWFGRVIGVDRKLTELIAAGTSICGASAVIATNTVTNTKDEDVAYAVACVTVFGSLSIFVYHCSQFCFISIRTLTDYGPAPPFTRSRKWSLRRSKMVRLPAISAQLPN
jgi:uncharacterized integral membrane protein (TIGR00698 family)